MSEIKIDATKKVWVAWTNTNLTDGYGQEFPLCIAESMETAQRRGAKGSVQGSDCRVTEEIAFRVNGQWFVPWIIQPETKEDTAKRVVREAREAALQRAKAAGLSDEDLKTLSAH